MEFADRGTEDIYDGLNSQRARKRLPVALLERARNKLSTLAFAETLDDLRTAPSNHLEKLRGDRAGEYSIRINDRYRVCFRWSADGATDVEIVDYH
jgi:toxin HigB-1